MLRAELIAIGSELLTPPFRDTNSTYLTEQLNLLGVPIAMRTVVGDNEDYLESAIRGALGRASIVIAVGGLGPTEDDVTKKVFARVLQRQLVLNDEILEGIERRFKARGIAMPANNARQALIPAGADVLGNRVGTAPGIWIAGPKHVIVLLPGPPSELQPMFQELCWPRLESHVGASVLERSLYRTTGLPESVIDERIASVCKKVKNLEVTVLSAPGQVDVHLTARAGTREEARRLLEASGGPIEQALDDFIYTRSDQALEEVVGLYLVMREATIAVAESCTGGARGGAADPDSRELVLLRVGRCRLRQ